MPKFLDNIEFYDNDGVLRKITDLEPSIREAQAEALNKINEAGTNWSQTLGIDAFVNFRDSHNNIENGTGENSVQQKYIVDETDYSAQATGENAVALNGKRYDKLTDTNRTPTSAEGKQSFAAGGSTHAYGDWSSAFGKDSNSYQRGSSAFGGGTQAGLSYEEWLESNPDGTKEQYDESYSFAFAQGELSKATGRGAHSEGISTEASGFGSHAEGGRTIASAENAHAEGGNTKALYPNSHAEGFYTITSKNDQHVCGRYNKENPEAMMIVGNGTSYSDTDRKNAFEVLFDGRAKVQSAPIESDDVVRKVELDNFNLVNGIGLDTLVLKYSPGYKDETNKPSSTTGKSDVCLGEANKSGGKRNIIAGKLNVSNASNSIIGGLGNGRGIAEQSDLQSLAGSNLLVAGLKNQNISGDNVILSGENNINYSSSVIISGSGNINKGNQAIISGLNNRNSSVYSVIAGEVNGLTQNNDETAYISGSRHIVAGIGNKVKKENNIVSGQYNNVSTYDSIVSGDHNIISGRRSLVVGTGNSGSFTSGIIFGESNTAVGDNVLIGGHHNSNNSSDQTVLGYYSDVKLSHLLTIGNGTSSAPSNAFVVYKNGNVVAAGDITSPNISALAQSKANKATTLSGYGITDAYTKEEVDTKNASTLMSAKSYTDTKIAEAITTALSTAV